MPDIYAYHGKPLTPKIAKELIKDHFTGEPSIKVNELKRAVDRLHIGLGGLESTGKWHHPVTYALTQLQKEGYVTRISHGTWQIGPQSSPPETENPENDLDAAKTIGCGEGAVYLYYFPTYRRAAQLEGKSTFPCKIGMTTDDANRRTNLQTGTGMPEDPFLALTIKTDTPRDIERYIHGILKVVGRHIEDAPGTEWFYTNPNEVEGIFNSLMELQSAR